MRLRGVLLTAVVAVAGSLVAAVPAQATTGTTVTPAVVHGTGLGFDACQAPTTAALRAWTASPYNAVNIYFSGSQRGCPNQPLLTPDWATTVLSNGWSLIPTVVDVQAPCYSGPKATIDTTRPRAQGMDVAKQADSDLRALGLGGAVAYLDLENFDIPAGDTTCGPVVRSFVRGFANQLHALGDKAGVYFNAHHGATTIVPMYGNPDAPDDVWVADWNGSPTPDDAVLGSAWPHHRIHQYFSDSTSETYAGVTINVDRNAIDGDVVAARSVSVAGYNVSAPGTGLQERTSPNTSAPTGPTKLSDGSALDIACQATGQAVNGDLVWDKLNGTPTYYVSDLFTTTTGRNGFSSSIPRCDTTPPTLSVTPQPQVTVGPTATLRWTAVDGGDPDGNPNQEARGISGTTVLVRTANWRTGFTSWRVYTTTTASSVSIPLTLGYTYCFGLQTRDLSGNASHWSPATCTTRPLDDRALSATTSGWTRKTSSRYYKLTFTKTWGDARGLAIANTRARFIGLLATTCPACGLVKVYIGSYYVGRVNLAAAGTHYKQLFMLKPFAIRSGTVKLVTKGVHLVQVDGIVISR